MKLNKHSIFTSVADCSEFKKKVNNLIDQKSKGNSLTHLKNILFFREDIFGFIENDKFMLWQYSWFWTGLFYPIVKGEIISNEEKYYVKMEAKLNLLGNVFCFLLIGMVFWAMTSMVHLRLDNYSLTQIALSLLGVSPWIIALYLIVRHNKIKFLKQLMLKLNLKNVW
ncbi:MAG TPA: hypothetical protein DCG75_10775 [Bacteroidales bacterium]|nr:hypothetical protein [Bacteroidales bacterium]